jgi:hypothetical protein
MAAAVVAGAWVVWRRPAVALPIFVVGLALHNLVLMVLVESGAPTMGIRAIQAWKEAYVGLLGLRLAFEVIGSGGVAFLRRSFSRWSRLPLAPRVLDLAALAFAAVLVLYLLLPSDLLPSPGSTLAQRVLSFRTLIFIPVLYLYGRVWPPVRPRDRQALVATVVGVAALVSLLGLIELWFVPTRFWVDWGIVRFDLFQGFNYRGPGGLPENFFQSTSTGVALRRMVSTYLSPLGIAYTGLLVVPLAVAAALASRLRSRWLWLAFTLVVVSIALSVTRLALACLAIEAIVLVGVFRRRAAVGAFSIALVAAAAALFVYPNYGPVVSFDLADVRPPAGAHLLGLDKVTETPAPSPGTSFPVPTSSSAPGDISGDIVHRIVTADDASIQAHFAAVRGGAEFVLLHPLGLGLGASISRLGAATGPGESAVFQIGGEVGLVGLLLFLVLYGGLILAGAYVVWRRRADPSETVLAVAVAVGGLALAPVVLTSQVWGDFSVTFLFWWLAGACIAAWPNRSVGRADKVATCARRAQGTPAPRS